MTSAESVPGHAHYAATGQTEQGHWRGLLRAELTLHGQDTTLEDNRELLLWYCSFSGKNTGVLEPRCGFKSGLVK